jgi:hypothetical protein
MRQSHPATVDAAGIKEAEADLPKQHGDCRQEAQPLILAAWLTGDG